MASNNGQFEQDNSSGFPDEMIRRFLLGDLSATERPAFEERLLVDDALAARVRLAELELADDYAYGQLSGTERELITEKFLLSADRERKVRVSRSLRDHFASAPNTSTGSAAYFKKVRSVFTIAQPVWRFAFAVVVLLVLFGAALLVIKEPRIVRRIANVVVPRRRPTPSAPREAGHPNNTLAPEHQTTPSAMPVHDQTVAPMIVSVSLMPTAASPGDATPWISLPKGDEDIARLQLAVKLDQLGPYHVELLTSAGQPVLSGELIKAPDNGAQVNFDVTARLLKSGDYQIRLSGDNAGATEELGKYYFRVR